MKKKYGMKKEKIVRPCIVMPRQPHRVTSGQMKEQQQPSPPQQQKRIQRKDKHQI